MGNLAEQVAEQVVEQLDRQKKAGTELVANVKSRVGAIDSTRTRVAAGVMLAALAAGAAFFIYTRRRRRPFGARLQGALPDSVRDLPDDIRAELKRRIRMVRAI
jgi:hypothetical protein